MAGEPKLTLDPSVQEFEGLDAIPFLVDDIRVAGSRPDLEALKTEVIEGVRRAYTLDGLKNVPEIRAYRDFFWRVGIDPTKTRPAGEALIRRVLGGKGLPTINTLVDTYNLASIKTRIALAAFDAATLHGDLVMRKGRPGEEFLGIGMYKPVVLTGEEVANVEVQRGSLVGQLDERRAARERRCRVQDVDQRHDGDDPAAALRARGDGGSVEAVGEREQCLGLVGVEHHLLALVVEEGERRWGHPPKGSVFGCAPSSSPTTSSWSSRGPIRSPRRVRSSCVSTAPG